jgi:hypothetical protein
MNIHVAADFPSGGVTHPVVGLFGVDSKQSDLETADVVIVESIRQLEKLHTDRQHFIVVAIDKPDELPENAFWFNPANGLLGIAKSLKAQEELKAKLSSPDAPTAEVVGRTADDPGDDSPWVLVIDNRRDNL